MGLPPGQILVQKLYAYLNRKQTLPRDLYDVIWLVAQKADLDQNFVKENKLPSELKLKAKEKFLAEKNQLENLKTKLRPFLINEKDADKLDFFLQVLDSLE